MIILQKNDFVFEKIEKKILFKKCFSNFDFFFEFIDGTLKKTFSKGFFSKFQKGKKGDKNTNRKAYNKTKQFSNLKETHVSQ